MIIILILNIFMSVASIIINLIVPQLPGASLQVNLAEIITTILSICNQGLNFLYFIFGDTIILVIPVAIALLLIKFTLIPLIQIFRSFFINSNN